MPVKTAHQFTPMLQPAQAVLGSLFLGSLLILIAGVNPLVAYRNLAVAGFGCAGVGARCALLTALQFATPLLLGGLSALVALRAGFFSLGQSGQMICGAAAASWLGTHLSLSAPFHPAAALLGGAAAGAAWGWIPAILRERVGVNEVIATLLMNPIAAMLVRRIWLPRIAETAHLPPLVHGTKLNVGLFIAVGATLVTYLYLWHSASGYEGRMTGQNALFARSGGIPPNRPVICAVMFGGALAGLAGAVEVLGVQYRFVTSFSAVDSFDGLIIAFAGGLHPLGAAVFAFLLGGLRAGAIGGLQIQSGVPRELGGALIALLLVFAARRSGAIGPVTGAEGS